MNAFTEMIDPHTSYFSPRTSDNFQISMSLSLEGIGAQLVTENEYTKVVRIIKGGPADKDGTLQADDYIVGVAQGEDGEIVDVVGWRIDDVVSLIRGEKGSKVRLSVIQHESGPDMPPIEIKLVRDKVKIEEQAAQKEVIDIEEESNLFRLGVIEVPAFYIDFEGRNKGEKDYKSTTRDVTRIIKELKEEGVDGIIIDLRNNGGGSLQEAVELTGLFIESGPIVQVKNTNGYIDVEKDPDEKIVYKGPLAVMINRYSASASEIFSAAIQDYGRGIVVGEQTFGKGTVQNLIDLNKFIPSRTAKRGQIKLTIAKYYRISGGSTQNLGVIPDIAYPSAVDPEEFGESARPSALPWDQIAPTSYEKYQDLSEIIDYLQRRHEERITKNIEFQYLEEDIEEYQENRNKKLFSLNIDVRKAEREKSEAKRKKREEERQANTDIDIAEMEEVSTSDTRVEDPLLEETGHILADFILRTIG
jgi:carboxyl-terminal processing protease